MEATQILLIIIVATLTIILTIIGVQFIFILKEFKKSIKKVNRVLDDGTFISGTVVKSVSGISGLLAGVKTGLSMLNFFHKEKDTKEDDNGKKK